MSELVVVVCDFCGSRTESTWEKKFRCELTLSIQNSTHTFSMFEQSKRGRQTSDGGIRTCTLSLCTNCVERCAGFMGIPLVTPESRAKGQADYERLAKLETELQYLRANHTNLQALYDQLLKSKSKKFIREKVAINRANKRKLNKREEGRR